MQIDTRNEPFLHVLCIALTEVISPDSPNFNFQALLVRSQYKADYNSILVLVNSKFGLKSNLTHLLGFSVRLLQGILVAFVYSCRLLFVFGYFLIWPSCWTMTHIYYAGTKGNSS